MCLANGIFANIQYTQGLYKTHNGHLGQLTSRKYQQYASIIGNKFTTSNELCIIKLES